MAGGLADEPFRSSAPCGKERFSMWRSSSAEALRPQTLEL